ncbi:hypothetical protein [Aquisalibacillus elongatus]|nr:hypothetical protein [Aquisalibacillus elongatus]
MKKLIIWVFICGLILFSFYFLINPERDDVTAEQDEPKPRITQDIDSLIEQAILNYRQLNEQHDQITVHKKSIKMDDPEVKNWIIHTHIQSAVLQNEELEGIELVDRAMTYKHNHDQLMKWAEKEHQIDVTDSEVDDYIQKQLEHMDSGQETQPFYTKLSQALNLSETEYFYEWEYDRMAEYLVQDQLFVTYQELYPQEDNESLEEYQDRIVILIEEDFQQYQSE